LTLESLLAEIAPLTTSQFSSGGISSRVSEVILVHDGAPDGSDRVISSLAERLSFVTPVWLSRNFGQHAATLAGMASTSGDWVVSLDEDGQHNPSDIFHMLDVAVEHDAQLVYAEPTNEPPHGRVRNFFSAAAKWVFQNVLGHRHIGQFNSFRLIRGDIARSLAAYCGQGTYLDVALSWVVGRSAHCPVALRRERAPFFLFAAYPRASFLEADIDLRHGSIAIGRVDWGRIGTAGHRNQRLLDLGQADRKGPGARLGLSPHCGQPVLGPHSVLAGLTGRVFGYRSDDGSR